MIPRILVWANGWTAALFAEVRDAVEEHVTEEGGERWESSHLDEVCDVH